MSYRNELDDIGVLLEFLGNSDRAENINITLPYSNNFLKKVDSCFARLKNCGIVVVYLISPDLFKIIEHSDNYTKLERIQYYYDLGRKLSLPGKYFGSRVIVDSSLIGHNYGWLLYAKTHSFIYTKHKLIIS